MVSYTSGAMHLPVIDDTDPLGLWPQTIQELAAAVEVYVGAAKPMTLVWRKLSDFTVPNGADTDIPWDFEDIDTLGAYAGVGAAHPERVTIPVGKGGLFHLGATVQWNGGASAAVRAALICVNGTPVSGNSAVGVTNNEGSQISTSRTWPLADGDYVTVQCFQNSGAGAGVGAGLAGTNLAVIRL